MPVFEVEEDGPNLWDEGDPAATALLSYLQKAGTALRVDEHSCVITPKGIKFHLERSPGGTSVDVDKVVRRYDWQILGSVLAQFLELGQAAHGSFSKSASDQDFFLIALQGILRDVIAETFNRFEVPRLFRLNRGSFPRLDSYPRLVPGDLIVVAFDQLAEPLAKVASAGLLTPGPALETWLRGKAGAPPEEAEAEGGMVGKARRWFRGLGQRHDDEDVHYTAADALAAVEDRLREGNGEALAAAA